MADYDSSLPIRSEADGTDERVHVKIVDYNSPTAQQMSVNTDHEALIEVHGKNPTAGDETLRLGELGQVNPDGDYDATDNTKPASVATIAHERTATPADTNQNIRVTGVTGSVETTHHSADVSIHDGNGNAYTASNPVPIYMSGDPGIEVLDYQTSISVVKDASVNHDYSIASGAVFKIKGLTASASGKIKVEFKIGDGAITETFATTFVGFNSTATPQIVFDIMSAPFSVTGTAQTTTLRITITNYDNSPQDVYSTLYGITQA